MLSNTHTRAAPPLLTSPETLSGELPLPCPKRPRLHLSSLNQYLHHQILDLDLLLLHHAEQLKTELAERRRRFSHQILSEIETRVSKKLKSKDDEIDRIKKLNFAMEERIRTISIENEIWKELAQTNEATANLLKSNLENILAAQIQIKEEQRLVDEISQADDAESCCCGGNTSPAAAEAAVAVSPAVGVCRSCGERETSVLILPCRHLCVCAVCAPIIKCCPVCFCSNNGTVNVNFS